MRKIIGLILFFGSWLVYAVLVFVSVDSEWSIAEKLGIGTALYATSWATMIIGSVLLGPEFVEKIKIMIRPKNMK
tara:strand:- start:2408 stop:2632 length:225 start_codon:yes stop_codon:yes gene_type:complete